MADWQNDALLIDGRPISELRVVDLKKELEKRGLNKSGTKKDLLERLTQFLKTQADDEDTDIEEDAENGDDNGDDDKTEEVKRPGSSSSRSSSKSSSSHSRSSGKSRSASRSPSPKQITSIQPKMTKEKSRSRSPSSDGSSGSESDSGSSRSPSPKRSVVSSVKKPTLQMKKDELDDAAEDSFHSALNESTEKPRHLDIEIDEETPVEKVDKNQEEANVEAAAEEKEDGDINEEETPTTNPEESGENEIAKIKTEDDMEEGEIKDSQSSSNLLKIKQEILSPAVSVVTGIAMKEEKETPKPVRKRRWGSTKQTTLRKQPIAISSDSLKTLIPDIKAVLTTESNAEQSKLAESEEEEEGRKIVKIRRTVLCEGDESGENENNKENEAMDTKEEEAAEEEKSGGVLEKVGIKKLIVDDNEQNVKPKVYRTISTQGSRPYFDAPKPAPRSPSPAHHDVTAFVHVMNLVRPFTLNQLKELLGTYGQLVDDGFWIDKIKSHCFATFESEEDAKKCREALHGATWPLSNPKQLKVDFATEEELKFHKSDGQLPKPSKPENSQLHERAEFGGSERARGEREATSKGDRSAGENDSRRSRNRSSPRRTGADRSRSDDRERRRERSRERKLKKPVKKTEEQPAKLLDDLFRKTKAVPSIYWLPLTDQQAAERDAKREKYEEERNKRIMLRRQQEEEAENARRRHLEERDRRTSRDRSRRTQPEKKKRSESREKPTKRERTRSHSGSRKKR
ncbi:apoptotic chromatin condensation inducer in the nucleus-like [Tubulanus polymorphus]|uniref:apoptotic chromatin condensation inducer in the nucleus-like n=1 Tax=Tubulanus polymorphus TaxID=672921 RepID=UPI003DA26A00